ncbi:DUF6086 family protein [Amycolatopsis sp. NPDC088138]|uniref:DUF6086 family protein n=1 Tax=Amycolatopsis sp. NPDC088138 TaxID=3363938 RepID=UPI003811C9B8
MSYIFDVDGQVVWSPALRVGHLFVTLADTLAGDAGVEPGATGLEMMASDYYYVNPPVFAEFVRTLLASSVVTNEVYAELARGFLVTSLVVLDRSGIAMTSEREAHRALFDARDALSSSM